jgi:hypothetical protein
MESGRGRTTGGRTAFAAVAVATTLIACVFASAGHAWAATIVGCKRSLPVLAHRAGGAIVKLPKGDRLPVPCETETGYASSESSLAVTKDGALVYSPAETENSMARSLNDGGAWSLTYPAQEQPTSFWNTVDPYVVADRRTGRVFWSHATGPVRNEGGLPEESGFYLAAAYGFQVYTSSDDAKTFTTADYQTAPTGDWEKVFVGPPPPASTGAAQPVGYPDVVYLCANSPLEVSGPGRLCYKSLDGGITFSPAGYTSPTASNPPDTCPPLNFNTGVVDSQGTIYQPVDCEHSAYVVISHDEGASETWIPEKDAPTGTVISGTNLQLAVDDADNLYAMWSTNGLVYIAISRDHAQTWGPPMMVTAPGLGNVGKPAIAAGAPGHVAVTYYASSAPSAEALSAYITQTADALDSQPLFYSGAINNPAAPIFHDYGLTGGSPRTDFVGGAFDSPGSTFWAGVVKQLGPATGGKIPTTGYVGTLRFSPLTPTSLP